MARLVALGDAHLGRSHLAHLRDEEGRNLREEDFLRSFAWAIDETLRQEPHGFVWLGDVFDHARPTYRTFAHVLGGLQRLADAGLSGVAISGNHDTPRVRGTGSPYDALERVFPGVEFAWRMEAQRSEIAGTVVHAVPQTLTTDDLRQQLAAAAGAVRPDAVNLVLAHVALTALPARAYRDINELEVEESAFDRTFDMVVLGHYHAMQKVSKRTWYAGSTDTFSFADSPEAPKGLAIVDTTDPTNATVVRSISGSSGKEVKVHGNYAYATTDSGPTHVIDISNPSQPMLVANSPTGHAVDLTRVGFTVAKQPPKRQYISLSLNPSRERQHFAIPPNNPNWKAPTAEALLHFTSSDASHPMLVSGTHEGAHASGAAQLPAPKLAQSRPSSTPASLQSRRFVPSHPLFVHPGRPPAPVHTPR